MRRPHVAGADSQLQRSSWVGDDEAAQLVLIREFLKPITCASLNRMRVRGEELTVKCDATTEFQPATASPTITSLCAKLFDRNDFTTWLPTHCILKSGSLFFCSASPLNS